MGSNTEKIMVRKATAASFLSLHCGCMGERQPHSDKEN